MAFTKSNNIHWKQTIVLIASVFFLLTQIVPPFNLLVPLPKVLFYPVFIMVFMLCYPDLLIRRSMISLYIYVGIIFVYFLIGNAFFSVIGTVTTPLLLMAGGLLITEYAFKYDVDFKYTKMLFWVVLLGNVFMAIISIPQVLISPNIIRWSFKDDAASTVGALVNWLIQYETIHGLPLLFAPLVYLCKKTFKKSLFWCIVFSLITIILFYIVYLSNATTPLLVSVMVIGLSLVYSRERFDKRSVLSFGVIGILLLVLSSPSVSVPILDAVLDNTTERGLNYGRIEQMKYNLQNGDDDDVSGRGDLYVTDLRLILESPIIGTSNSKDVSKHSFFLDRLAVLGIFFFIPLVLIFYYNIRMVYRRLNHTKVVYSFGILIWLFLLLYKSEFGQGSWLYGFAFLPVICRYIDRYVETK